MYKFEKVVGGITVKSNEEINEEAVKEQIADIRKDGFGKGVTTIFLPNKLFTKKQVKDVHFLTGFDNNITTIGDLIEELKRLPKDMTYEECYGGLSLATERDTVGFGTVKIIETKVVVDR